jgi:hypothetical protein
MRRNKTKDDADIDDARDVIPDGGSVRVPVLFMDAAGHRSGYVNVTSPAIEDARREARESRQRWIKQMCDAWRMPVSITPVKDAAEPDAAEALLKRHLGELDADAVRRRDAALRARDEQLVNAWKTLGRSDPREADRIERQRRGSTAERRGPA